MLRKRPGVQRYCMPNRVPLHPGAYRRSATPRVGIQFSKPGRNRAAGTRCVVRVRLFEIVSRIRMRCGARTRDARICAPAHGTYECEGYMGRPEPHVWASGEVVRFNGTDSAS